VAPSLRTDPSELDALATVGLDLHRFISQLQRPRVQAAGWSDAALERCQDLSGRVAAMSGAATTRKRAAGEAMDRMTASLRAYAVELSSGPNAVRLKQFGRRLAEDYEDFRQEFREFRREDGTRPIRLPHVKPVTWARGVFHGLMGLSAVLLYQFVLTQAQAVTIMGVATFTAVTLEVTRRFSRRWNRFLIERVFGPVARPWERHRTNSGTYYTLALFIVAAVMPKPAAEVGILALAFGDPAASLIGRKWGSRKLWRDKSIVGTAAFVVFSFLATAVFLFLAVPGLSLASRLLLPAAVAGAGAVAELASERLDDNLTIPVLCASIAALWFV
jgi:dolichol kinase